MAGVRGRKDEVAVFLVTGWPRSPGSWSSPEPDMSIGRETTISVYVIVAWQVPCQVEKMQVLGIADFGRRGAPPAQANLSASGTKRPRVGSSRAFRSGPGMALLNLSAQNDDGSAGK